MRNAAIGFALSAAVAVALRYYSGASSLGALLFFMLAAVFAAIILVGLVSRIGHTPRGAASILGAAALMAVGVYWWIERDTPFDRTIDRAAFAITEQAGQALETAESEPLAPHAEAAGDAVHR